MANYAAFALAARGGLIRMNWPCSFAAGRRNPLDNPTRSYYLPMRFLL